MQAWSWTRRNPARNDHPRRRLTTQTPTPIGYGYGCGVVFKLAPKGKETVLYSFCAQKNCADGWGPLAGLTFDQKGNLYGTTSSGGLWYCDNADDSDVGCAVFKVSPEGKETVLYSFCAQKNCADGAGSPIAGLTFDQKGNLYGTTAGGGAYYHGVVFKLTPEGLETILQSFCERANCADGSYPRAGVVFDRKGNLYGTTEGGGTGEGGGVVFKLTPEGKYTVLYSSRARRSNCADGSYPSAGVVFDRNGNLYGTFSSGGAAAATTISATMAGDTDVVWYSSSLQKARRRFSTASAHESKSYRRVGACFGGLPSTRREPCTERPSKAGPSGGWRSIQAHAMNPASAENGPRCCAGVPARQLA